MFFRYLAENDYILINPFDKVDSIKKVKTLPKNIPGEKEIVHIMKKIDISNPFGFRDRTMFEVIYSTGIRRKELAQLSVYDIDINNGFIHVVKGKRGKARIIPVGKIACTFLEKYITQIRPALLKSNVKEDALFISKYGRKLSIHAIDSRIKMWIHNANLNTHYTCHSFRHACATEMLKGKANIKYVQEMLGHSCLSSTQIYTHVLPLDLFNVHKKTHPSWILFDDEKKQRNKKKKN